MNRHTLSKLAEKIGCQTWTWANKRKVPLRNDALRVRMIESLFGPNTGTTRANNLHELDKYLAMMVRADRGELGRPLAAAQYHLRAGNHARAEAIRLYNLPSRPYKRIMAAMAEAKEHYAKAAEWQAKHEESR